MLRSLGLTRLLPWWACTVALFLPMLGCGADECPIHAGLSAQWCDALMRTKLPEQLPAARDNSVADLDEAAALGLAIFFDARFSHDLEKRCATCHVPEYHFQDAAPTPSAFPNVARNSQDLLSTAWLDTYTWDGKFDAMWLQGLVALEHADEMAYSRLEVAHRIFQHYRQSFEDIFGALPPLDDPVRFPAQGRPGSATFDGMSAVDRLAINEIFANTGRALEAYVRRLAVGPSPWDLFLAGQHNDLGSDAKAGAALVAQAGCLGCHGGPAFADSTWHVLAVNAAGADLGRAAAVAKWDDHQLADLSPHLTLPVFSESDAWGFRTPSLRNVLRTAPYWHDGRFETWPAAVAAHDTPPSWSAHEQQLVQRFFESLNGRLAEVPWSGWPDR